MASRPEGQAIRILITGASGWVGGRLIRHLLETPGVEVRAASRSARPWPAGVEGCVTDLGEPATLLAACRGADAVVNLAAMPEAASAADPEGALRVNSGGALAWARAAAAAGAARFVQVSTAKVYGRNLAGVVTEETPCDPRSHYAINHFAAERFAAVEHRGAVILRLANAFGPANGPAAGCWDAVINDFCRQAAATRRIVIASSGLSWRNFVPMSDVTRALALAAGQLAPGVYNLGSRRAMTLLEAAGLVAASCRDLLEFQPAIVAAPPPAGESHAPLVYAIDRLASAGFEPAARFEDEIDGTLRAAQTAE